MTQLYRFKSEYVFNANSTTVSVRKNGLYFNTASTAILELQRYSTITVDYDHINPKFAEHLYIQGSNDPKSDQNFVIAKGARESKSRDINARFVASQQLINTFPSLKHLSSRGEKNKKGLTRLPAEYDFKLRKLKVKLIPQLEYSTYNNRELPTDGGVYAYVQGKEVVYYGQTNNLQKRALQHAQNKWNFDQIRYSFVSNESSRLIWEKHYLDLYLNQNGSLPRYNLIGGHKNNLSAEAPTANGGLL